jgi:multidrug resistance protein MdtO
MAPLANAAGPAPPALLTFLREELAPRPGRVAAVSRIAGSCVVLVIIAMLFQIPMPHLVVFLVFSLTRGEAVSTLLVGVVAALAVTIAAALSLVFCMIDSSEPAVRLLLMVGSCFLGFFLVSTTAFGPVVFLATFVLVMSQTMIDTVPTVGILAHTLLWLWVVVMIPDAVTILINLLFGEQPAQLGRRTTLKLLRVLATALRSGNASALPSAQAETVGLVLLRQRAGMFDRGLRSRTAFDTRLIETLVELLTLQSLLPASTPIEARLQLAEACDASSAAFERDEAPVVSKAPRPADAVLTDLSPEARPVMVAIAGALTRLSEGIAGRRAVTDASVAPTVNSIFAADAFSNPGHVRFALKTTIAVMTAYITYTLLDWPGINSILTTCFFVAQGSVGETIHKLTLRLVGATLGGLLGGLCIVFVLPEMDDIGQLCLLIGAGAAICGWVATSSDRLSYAGVQMALAFFMGVLQGFGPSTDLTVLRDRVIGILLGNVLMSIVFSVFWPTSAVDRVRSSVAAAFRTLGHLLTDPAEARAGARLAVIRALGDARRFAAIAAFERPALPAREVQASETDLSLALLDRLAGATFVIGEQSPNADIAAVVHRQDAVASAWFFASAERLTRGDTAPISLDASTAFDAVRTSLPNDTSISSRAAVEARVLLKSEIENAIAVRT